MDPISRAIFPAFSTLATNKLLLRRAVIQSAGIIALLTLPLGTGIAVLAQPLVWLVLGEKWSESVPIINILAIYGIMRAAHAGTGSAYNAIGVPRIITLINLPHLIVGWPLMAVAVPSLGLVGIGYAIISASMIGLIINYNFAVRLLDLAATDIVGYYWRPLIACVAMAGVELVALHFWPPSRNISLLALQMGGYVTLGASTFVTATVALWLVSGRPSGAEEILFQWLSSKRTRASAAS